jgi:hypothetical protein
MSTNNEVALRLALEALTKNSDRVTEIRMKADAIKALEIALSEREALASKQSDSVEQSVSVGEPVENRFVRELREYGKTNQGAYLFPSWDIHRALKYLDGYTTPYVPTGRQQRTAERKPLTDEQIAEAVGWVAGRGCKPLPIELQIARAIEAAHGIHPSDFKEKNT